MFPSQSNTQPGARPVTAGADLRGKEGLLVVLANSAGLLIASIVAALTDVPLHVLVDGAAAGKAVMCQPLTVNENVRLRLYQTCNPSDVLVLADPVANAAAQAGMVRALPATAGVYVGIGKAEEIGVDGQLILVRPTVSLIHVKSADTITGAADLTATKAAVLAILQAHGIVT